MAITSDGARAYVTTNFQNSVAVIDTDPVSPRYHTVIARVAMDPGPNCVFCLNDVSVTPDGTRAYVTNYDRLTPDYFALSVIDTDPLSSTYHTVVAGIRAGRRAIAVAIAPDGAFAYVTNNETPGTVSVIDTDLLSPTYYTPVATVPVGTDGTAVWLAITPDGAFAHLPDPGRNVVSVIDTASYTVAATVSMPPGISGPFGVAITPDGAFAYVTCMASSVVSVIDTATRTAVRTVAVGTYPRGVAITPF